jgi:hypothetical protein
LRPTGSNWNERTLGWIGDHGDRRAPHRRIERRVREVGERAERREVREHGEQAASEHDPLAADAVGQDSEHDEERRAEHQRGRDDEVRLARGHVQDLLEEEQRVELAAVPDDGLACRRTEQQREHEAQVPRIAEGVGERGLRQRDLLLQLAEHRRFLQLQADVHRDREQHRREQERDAPAPLIECVAERHAAAEDHEQREEGAERRGRLDPARVPAANASSAKMNPVVSLTPEKNCREMIAESEP